MACPLAQRIPKNRLRSFDRGNHLSWPTIPSAAAMSFSCRPRAFQTTLWQPSVDAYKIAGGWLLKYELAGVMPEEVQVVVDGPTITVRGMRRDVRVEEGLQSYCMEISYNQFARTLTLPCDLSAMAVSTDYRDGMLMVRLIHKGSGT